MLFEQELKSMSDQSIAHMQDSARKARRDHAAAELVRHMIATARKNSHRDRDTAVQSILTEWMGAWHLSEQYQPETANHMRHLTEAFFDFVQSPTDATDLAVRSAWSALQDAYAKQGNSLEDEMAWRSICAHEWWGHVAPAPDGFRDFDENRPSEPFWEKGCPPSCLG